MDEDHILWRPDPERVERSPLHRYQAFLRERTDQSFDCYSDLHQWSVTDLEGFWQSVWDFTELRASRQADAVLSDGDRFPGDRWFDGARLNYAENLLSRRSDGTAIVARLENGQRREISWPELHTQVALSAAALRESGVAKGDRVAGMLPNVPETIIAMLATASIGALWSSCSPDFGVSGVLDRFGQIQPKVLIACDGYFYNGKTIDCRDKVAEVASQLSLSTTVVVPLLYESDVSVDVSVEGAIAWPLYLAAQQTAAGDAPGLLFEQLPFDHPLFIMYSSGTTGAPKCIVHSAGGTLLQHLKEHQLHVGLTPGDVLFYFTTCGWMMWNWMVGGLASGATLVLYDGSPFYPAPDVLLDIVDEDGINVFGVGAKYISALEKQGIRPATTHRLTSLRTVLSTGSPLSHESFRYIYRDVKQDVCLSSISGGTDIISCFVLGNECLPVYEGELQCPGLGMAVEVWDEEGQPVTGTKGEMVCVKPFPSAPVGFWNDPDGKRYHDAYFSSYDGIWAHGDYAEVTPSGGMIIHGRSDAVLNPGGVRIGTAEIYRQVEKIDAVMDSVCIGQNWDDDVRVVLFVVLKAGEELSDELAADIRLAIRKENTPRHVPAKILAVTDIPRTRSGKIAEIPVRKVVNGETIDNTESLANPESLHQFENRPELET
ncbi:acetoacetate--CoA ligase [Congregibacter litoralis]|uniref:Acyl-coenzyme A synthetase/AMP-(Fatty) acid ligase n=1 Tax=Congregibacter litoralis KT71 TaxID=314285 RepID=A4ABT7_9GAMM|nr:acetoacetate--CoA ligase [Congregibacter litoralis]EAQ96600.1 Acyl-coenzyme A synthetase/AMP-(fatty) acid ligase [Congregibacter litoralis KT71]